MNFFLRLKLNLDNFDGKFRREPQQNLSGSHTNDVRNELLLKAQNARFNRYLEKKIEDSAIKIQSYIRAYLCRSRLKQRLNERTKELLNNYDDSVTTLAELLLYVPYLTDENIIPLTKLINKNNNDVIKMSLLSDVHMWRLKQYIWKIIKMWAGNKQKNEKVAVETFYSFLSYDNFLKTQLNQWERYVDTVLSYIVNKKFYYVLKCVIDDVDEMSTFLKEMSLLPLQYSVNNPKLRLLIITDLFTYILTPKLTPFIRHILYPTLSNCLEIRDLIFASKSKKCVSSMFTNPNWLYYMLNLANTKGLKNLEEMTQFIQLSSILTRHLDQTTCYNMLQMPLFEDVIINTLINTNINHYVLKDVILIINNVCNVLNNNLRIYYRLIFQLDNYNILAFIWHEIINHKVTINSTKLSTLKYFLSGKVLPAKDANEFFPALNVFSCLFNCWISSFNDDDFQKWWLYTDNLNQTSIVKFGFSEFLELSQKSREIIITLLNYHCFVLSENFTGLSTLLDNLCISLKLIQERNDRLNFINEDQMKTFCHEHINQVCHFIVLMELVHDDELLNIFPLFTPIDNNSVSVLDLQLVVLLKKAPILLSFVDRFTIFRKLMIESKNENIDFDEVLAPILTIRRQYLYESAFSHSELFTRGQLIRIMFTNELGVNEPGIDGGGVYKEFLVKLSYSGFRPDRGFFAQNNNNQLYPNPYVKTLVDNAEEHYNFLGKVLALVILEGLQLDLSFADFFLNQIITPFRNIDDIDKLKSLDQQLADQLLEIRHASAEQIEDYNLDFTLVVDDFGNKKVIELKPNGSNIPVNKDNLNDYVELVMDYKLRQQIEFQVKAFKKGFLSIIPENWLILFSSVELQTIISGRNMPIDLEDMKKNVYYEDGYSFEHPTIQMFWQVLETFTPKQMSKLLTFVTSCPRPPLLGFKDLDPKLTIQASSIDNNEWLPTSSTCANLLKLPIYKDVNTLKEKLIYAIENATGFELS